MEDRTDLIMQILTELRSDQEGKTYTYECIGTEEETKEETA